MKRYLYSFVYELKCFLGVVVILDLVIFGVVAFGGGVVALIGFLVIIGRRINEPNKELQQKFESLENEVKSLKDKN
ncbi:hypothetical protein [Halobacillus salinus]|uniref:Uncharacterized protein n=1 Tax=Halobacillus salinus TaxID=192814 RepID=A0A4Z0H2I3_9BACI|nr:hypothetical protein [Halobacillus salinus]TGB03621.1 hypothetical protein E4663_01045 [Halobacillus salinus]